MGKYPDSELFILPDGLVPPFLCIADKYGVLLGAFAGRPGDRITLEGRQRRIRKGHIALAMQINPDDMTGMRILKAAVYYIAHPSKPPTVLYKNHEYTHHPARII